MTQLRVFLMAAVCGVILGACGDDDSRMRGGTDAGPPRDMNVPPPVDLGPGVDGGGGGGTDGGGGGVDMGGGGGMCPAGECNLLTNGCPAGEGCYFLSMGMGMPPMPLCDMSGIGTLGATCSTYRDCASGFTCQGGTCQKYCCELGSSMGCPAGAMCSIVLTDGAGMPTGAALCRTAANCDIFGSTCPSGEACYLAGGDGTTDCAMAGMGTTGATCEFTNDCAAGFSCLGSMGGRSCRKLCDTVDMNPGCAAGETCTSLGIPAPLTNVGACTAP
jgi:hypothetical protein